MDYSKGDEGMDEILPIKVDITCQKTKCENRRLSLPVIEDTKTFRVRGFTYRKSQPIEQTSNSTAKDLATGQGLAKDLELSPTRQMYSDRRSTSMPEFYGLTEFRAKHDKKEMSKNKLRRTKTRIDSKHLKDETTVGLPALSSSSLPMLDRKDEVLLKEDKDGQIKYQPRRKTYLPRINPNSKSSLVRKRNSEISEIKFNPDGMSHSKP